MTPAGTSNELDVQDEWEENTHTHTQQQKMSQRQSTTPVAPSEKALEAARDLFLVQGSGTYHRPCRSLHWAIVKPTRWLSWQTSRAAPSHFDCERKNKKSIAPATYGSVFRERG